MAESNEPPVAESEFGLTRTCSRCGGGVEFTGLKLCTNCRQIRVVPLNEAVKIVEQRLSTDKASFARLMNYLPMEWLASVLPDVFEDIFRIDGHRGLRFDYSAWALTDALLHATHGRNVRPAPNEDELREATMRLHRLAFRVQDFVRGTFDIPQGARCLVEGEFDSDELGFYDSSPILVAPVNALHRRMTRLAYGIGPQIEKIAPDLARQIEKDSPQASLFALLKHHDLDMAAVNSLHMLQNLSAYAPMTKRRTERIRTKEHLYNFLSALIKARPPQRIEAGETRHAAKISKQSARRIARGTGGLATVQLLTWGSATAVCPILFPTGGQYVFSSSLAQSLRNTIYVYMQEGRRSMAQWAADTIEDLVAKVANDLGYETEIDGHRLVRVKATRKRENEIDVIAFEGDSLYLIEVKAHAEPPGAWAVHNVSRRREEIRGWQESATAKAEFWKDKCDDSNYEIWADGRRVRLPSRDWTIRPLIISTRLEPRIEGAHPPVFTMTPPEVARIWQRLLPLNEYSSVWSTDEKLPVADAPETNPPPKPSAKV